MSGSDVLLGGFMPFDIFSVNSSFEMIRHLDGATVGEMNVHTAKIPVEFGHGAKLLTSKAEKLEPALVITFGLADSPAIRLETTAFNRKDARIPDNRGAAPIDEPVVECGPERYGGTLPLESIMTALERSSIPVSHSDSAGAFVCNDLYYHLMHWVTLHRPGMPAGFIHVPPLAGSGGKNGWERSRLEESARIILEACIGTLPA